ncbi:probable inactive receptor kinase At5g58300 [Euphorbia lathyris]|uniref:probable inactive receptor kinase At5g58300 n=1 Tax=Euphorbia lathyris TaxID=212925 RepID=UPI003313A491
MKLQSYFSILTFFILYIPPNVTSDLTSDKQALLDFAAAVPHVRKLNWNISTSVCSSWCGISCNPTGTRVTAIHLPGVGLYGPIPRNTISKLDSLRFLSLRSNYLNGNIPSDLLSLPSLRNVYLQRNNFSGNIPPFLSPKLSVLDLSVNALSGNIPRTLQKLEHLSALYLENNSLSSDIPDMDIPTLKLLNLSFNKFRGPIPESLRKFPSNSFDGNSLLCGLPLNPCPIVTPTPAEIRGATSKKKLRGNSIVSIAIGGFAVVFLVGMLICVCCWKKRDRGNNVLKGKSESEKPKDFGSGIQEAEKNKLFFFEGCHYSFDLEDLLRASAEVLGKGSYGTAYKAVLEDGTTVVVKRLKEVMAGKKEFEQQMELIGRMGRHDNVVPLRAYYYSKDEKLLVYNYMPRGSFSALLHGNRGTGTSALDWNTRLKICLGAAKGIAHIHSEGSLKSLHGNIKSSNILVTSDLDGCISDIGLTPLMNLPSTISRTIGYRAPEVIETRKINHKSDVYSFGVVLLEMLTGKAPVREDVVDLPRWVRSVVREEWTAEVFDVELMKYPNIEEEMVQMLQIALACVTKVQEMRPTMDEVVRMMEGNRQSDSKNHSSSQAESDSQTP